MTRRRGRWLFATASAAVALGAAPAWGEAADLDSAGPASASGGGRSAAPATPVLRPEEEMLLEVRTPDWILEQAFPGYSTPTGTYLPLGAFARLLDFAIVIDGDSGRGEGWFLEESNSFRIDVNAGFVETKDGRKQLQPGDAVATLGDIYVRPALLSQWFPLEAEVSLPKQQVQLKLLAKFPFEAKIEREGQRERLAFRPAAQRLAYPREETIYRMMGTPALDVNIQATTGTGQATETQYDVRASGDFAFMNADLFLSGNRRRPLDDMRFVLRRRDPDGELLGPLGLTLVELGDTSSIAQPIGARSRTGRGFVFSNLPIDRESVFDQIDLRGELPIGWEVELYRNDVLIGSVSRGVDGRYEFLQVPLEFGLNVLRLVFYGPHGERREEVRQINAGEGRLSKGDFQFAVSAVQQDENLIPIHREELPGSQIDSGKIRAVAMAEYGLSARITAVAGVSSFFANEQREYQGLAGIRTNLGAAAVKIDAAFQRNGSWAAQTGLAGRLFDVSYVLQHAEYGGAFVDELRGGTAGAYKRYTQLRLDRGFSLGSQTIATNLVAERSERGDSTEWTGTFRASTSIRRWLVSNILNYRRTDSDGSSSDNFDGMFDLNGAIGGWGVRAGVSYNLKPGAKFRDVSVALDHDLGSETLLRATVTHQLSGEGGTRAGASLSRRLGAFDLGADVQYDTASKHIVAGLRLSFSFGRGLGGWRFVPPGLARGGSLIALAFRDLNGDGLRGDNEPLLEGIGFRGGSGEAKTNADGLAFLSGLGDGRPAQVTMISDSLPDPYLTPVRPGIEVVPRPGRTHRALFPVASVSEVEGHAFFRGSAGDRAVSNVQLQLVDSSGNVLASAKTEYDGYFFLERVPPGEYSLRLDPEQAAKLDIRLADPVLVKADGNGGLVGNIVVNIIRGVGGAVAAN